MHSSRDRIILWHFIAFCCTEVILDWNHTVIYKKVGKKILQTTDPYTTILKNRLQKTLDIIIREHQSVAIKEIEQTFDTVNWDLSFLLCKNLDMETNSFAWLSCVHQHPI